MFSTSKFKTALPVFGLAALCFTIGASQVRADGGGSFSLSGKAKVVVGGVPTNPASCGNLKTTPPGCYLAIDLTSNCGNQTYSNTCYFDPADFVYSNINFTPSGLTVDTIAKLSTDYNIGGASASCTGGAPRFVIQLQNGDNLVANFGITQFGTCYNGWQNTGNMANDSAGAVWSINLANTFVTWSQAVAAESGKTVTSVSIVLDGGWITQQGQDVTIDNFTVNGAVLNGALN